MNQITDNKQLSATPLTITTLTILRKFSPPPIFALNFCTNCKSPQIGIYSVAMNHFYRMANPIRLMLFPHAVCRLYWMQNAL